MRPTSAPWTRQHSSAQPCAYFRDVGEGRDDQEESPGDEGATLDLANHTFVVPEKWIRSEEDLQAFLRSNAARDLVSFLNSLSCAVEGKKVGDETHVSELLEELDALLHELAAWVEDIPPAETRVRFGNPSYRVWHARMEEHAMNHMERILPKEMAEAAKELVEYWKDSFGNASRIDYGTGHETNFMAFLYCLARMGLVRENDRKALVLRIFNNYLRLMRKVQITYWLEPAGSHGVWGLDDYQHLPFYFGAAQLMGHKYITPRSIHNFEVLEGYGKDYMYLSSVAFVLHVKKGPLKETSPILSDVSSVKDWGKVNRGMLRMYQNEVMGKFPIMQHFLFGSIIVHPQPTPKNTTAG
eukprot:scaffold45_cov337-Pavlova_lutheri.AAC.10